jgi:RNA polymerase sigma factor (sigma-70 family)
LRSKNGPSFNLDDISHIIEGCKKNDRLSQEKLYRQFYPALFALCKTFFENNHDILTALNNGMLRVYKNIERFDQNKGTFFNWVYTIVRNAALTLVRDKKTETHLELLTEDIQSAAIYNPFHEKEWAEIFLLLGKLPQTTRAVCSLYYMEGFSMKEISAALEIKEGTVKWHLNESRKRLKMIAQPN